MDRPYNSKRRRYDQNDDVPVYFKQKARKVTPVNIGNSDNS